MNLTADTLKLSIPKVHVHKLDSSSIKQLVNMETGVIEHSKIKPELLKDISGLKSIQIKLDNIILEFSAKILGKDYFKGISLETIYSALQAIQATGLIRFKDVQKVINASDVCRVDVNNNVRLDNINHTLCMLNKYSMVKDWQSDFRLDNLNKSISFKQKIKTYPLRWIGYSKELELAKADNREFIIQQPKVYDSANGIFRVETNVIGFKRIQRELSINDNKLKTVLLSDENVNLNVLNRITKMKMKPETKTFKTKKQDSAYIDAYFYLTQSNFDLEVLETMLIQRVPSLAGSKNLNSYIKKYAEYANEIQNDIAKEKGLDCDVLLDELKTKLYKSFNQ